MKRRKRLFYGGILGLNGLLALTLILVLGLYKTSFGVLALFGGILSIGFSIVYLYDYKDIPEKLEFSFNDFRRGES